jgi:hypothetical protein
MIYLVLSVVPPSNHTYGETLNGICDYIFPFPLSINECPNREYNREYKYKHICNINLSLCDREME